MTAAYDMAVDPTPFRIVGRGVKAPSSNWVDIECPFCHHVVRAYIWSLSGSGKKCKCGAIHGSYGGSRRALK